MLKHQTMLFCLVLVGVACSSEETTDVCEKNRECGDNAYCKGLGANGTGKCTPCGTEEVLYDGDDNDCNFNTRDRDLDKDGDNWVGATVLAGGDCDDNDPDVNSKQHEICGDNKDNNCDSTVDESHCADKDPPTVSIVNPTTSGPFTGTVAVELAVTDDAEMDKVEIFVGDDLVHTWQAPPYTVSIDSRTFDDGSHSLKGVATNVFRQEGTDEQSFRSANYSVSSAQDTCQDALVLDFSLKNPITIPIRTTGAVSDWNATCCPGRADVAVKVLNPANGTIKITCSGMNEAYAVLKANGDCTLQEDPNGGIPLCGMYDQVKQILSGQYLVILHDPANGPFSLTLTAGVTNQPVSFSRDIHPKLVEDESRGGIGCYTCHMDSVDDASAPGGLYMTSDVNKVYQELTQEMAEDDGLTNEPFRINTQFPEKSLLLTNPLDGDPEPHDGKLIPNKDDPNYRLFYSWIVEGGANN